MPDVFVSDESNQPTQEKPEQEKTDLAHEPVKIMSFFSSFTQKPDGIQFGSQEPGEKVELFIRWHFTRNIRWVVVSSILLILPLVLFNIGNIFNIVQSVVPYRFLIVFIAFYYLIVIGFIFTSFITWFYNVGIITNKQIIDLDFTDIMFRNVAKARIEDVVDVEFTQGGLLDSFFDFGHVFIQTEGVKPNFEFNHVPHPDKITDIILDLKSKYHKHE